MPETLVHISGRARKKIDTRAFLVGVPGIEPGLHPPHGRVLPVYYTPSNLALLL